MSEMVGRDAKLLSFLEDPSYHALKKHYMGHPMALFTGAGISWSDDDRYGLPNWDKFIRDILVDHDDGDRASIAKFDEKIKSEWVDKPWMMADWVAERCGRGRFKALVVKRVQRKENFRKKKLLTAKYLDEVLTLNSVSTFCTELIGVVKRPIRPTISVAPNHRVRAIVTSNYDPYLEAAASTKYRGMILKPVGAFGSHVGSLAQIPVFHVHGYVRFPTEVGEGRELRPFVNPVVTTSDYKEALGYNDAYCPTLGMLIHILRHYSALFVGFSFRDPWINDTLKRLNEERKERLKWDRLYHFALVHRKDIERRGIEFYRGKGVRPISLDSFDEVYDLLRDLYKSALLYNHGSGRIEVPRVKSRTRERTGEHIYLTPDQCWELLFRARRLEIPRFDPEFLDRIFGPLKGDHLGS